MTEIVYFFVQALHIYKINCNFAGDLVKPTKKTVNEPTKIELLAPGKNLAVGRVAIESGADAVYIGGPAFGARKAAGNSLEDIAELCRYAHLFGARVFTTLNTLLHDDEMAEAVSLACAYKEIGVDAILIQDLRLARILLNMVGFEGMLHASTQCDNRSLERVQQLEQMGFSQVVLARELSYQEMRAIREHTSVALEAFVHGALCVSYSGACYLSEAVCGRSANRGECAQMCRLTYDVLDADGREMRHEKHVLSLYDLDRSEHLRELLETGVTTLKIEGRLKDQDYVRNVVAYYRQKLDRLFAESQGRFVQASRGRTKIAFTPDPAKTFHRGRTEYFSFERPDNLVNMLTPKSTGEFLGRAPIQDSWNLHNGDGLVAGELGFYWPSRVKIPAGTPVYRTYNAEFQKTLAAKDAATRVLPVRLTLSETEEGFALRMEDGERSVECQWKEEKIPAENGERAEAMVRQQLTKLGDTPFEAESVEIVWSRSYFCIAKTLNAWRREVVAKALECWSKIDNGAPNTNQRSVCGGESEGSELFNKSEALAEELSQPARIPNALMTCKYCLLNEMGCCKKLGKAERMPTFLRRGDLLLRIETDCKNCQMTLVKG